MGLLTKEELNEQKLAVSNEAKASYQALILPINNTLLLVSKNSDAYITKFGRHCNGWIMKNKENTPTTVWGSGAGYVLKAGYDDNFGYVVIVRYDNCWSAGADSLIFRYMFLASATVKAGQYITKDTKLGTVGGTGRIKKYPDSQVLLEVDQDIAYPEYSPSLQASDTAAQIIKKGIDSTMIIPGQVIQCKRSAPDSQSFDGGPLIDGTTGKMWYRPSDVSNIQYRD